MSSMLESCQSAEEQKPRVIEQEEKQRLLGLPHHSLEWLKLCEVVATFKKFKSLDQCLEIMYAFDSVMLKDAFPIAKTGGHEKEVAATSREMLRARYKGLVVVVETKLSAQESDRFIKHIFPFMLKLLLDLPSLFSVPVPLLLPNTSSSFTISSLQAASLLSCFFFSLHKDPRLNFKFWISSTLQTYQFKLRCIIEYFFRVYYTQSPTKSVFGGKNKEMPQERNISIHRNVLTQEEINLFSQESLLACQKPLSAFVVAEDNADAKIEKAKDCLQVNFANKLIGGHVLATGCVQEEIRFSINPECLCAMLICSEMLPHESITVLGAETVASYEGYGGNTTYKALEQDSAPLDTFSRRCTAIVGIDAEAHPLLGLGSFRRDVIKAFAGFSLSESVLQHAYSEVATGNWGCGMFGGDPQTKAMLQWTAASMAGRGIRYFVFREKRMVELADIINIISSRSMTVSDLWRLLTMYVVAQDNKPAPSVDMTFFDFLRLHAAPPIKEATA